MDAPRAEVLGLGRLPPLGGSGRVRAQLRFSHNLGRDHAANTGQHCVGGVYWVTLDSFVSPIHNPNSVNLNGSSVSPVSLPKTNSPCQLEQTAHAYFADVTTLVVGGANVVSGLEDSGLATVAPETEGASIFMIYEDDSSGACEIIVMDGNDLIDGPFPTVTTNAVPVQCGGGSPATLWFAGGDGQPFVDNQQWNGINVGDGDDFDDSDPNVPGAADGWDTDARSVATGATNVAGLPIRLGLHQLDRDRYRSASPSLRKHLCARSRGGTSTLVGWRQGDLQIAR